MRTVQAAALALGVLFPAGQETPWARDWPEAARRARDERKLVLVLAENYRGLKISDRLPLLFLQGPLADLLRERFVGLRWRPEMGAPLRDPAAYGAGPFTFGAAILVAAPDGRIVGECAALGEGVVDDYLRFVLLRHPEATGRPPVAGADPLDRAEAHLRRGELEPAAALLERPGSARASALKARLLRRLRKGEEALAELRRAKGAGEDAELLAEEGAALLGLGRAREAAEALVAILDRHPGSPRAAEAKYLLSRILLRSDFEGGKAGLEETVRTCAGTPWAALAQALLASGALEAAGAARLGWPDGRMLEVARESTPAPLPLAKLEESREGAIRFLLGAQLADGSWITPANLSSENPAFSIAATAIAGASLLPFRDRKEVAAALGRAVERVLAARSARELDRQPLAFGFGYAVWGRIFALRFLARCSAAGVGPAGRLAEAMDALAGELAREQTPGGGWSYFGGMDLSFVTAAAVLALVEARERGAKVPPDVLRRGLDCVEGARGPKGEFRYARGGGEPGAQAGLRSPLGALALLRGGRGDAEGVRRGLEHYLGHRLSARKERGKALCHTSPDGTAAYYLLYGYAFAAEALETLPAADREPFRRALVEDVLQARREDGGFADFPATGPAYGTGMALAAMARLGDE